MSMGPRYAEHASQLLAGATPELSPPREEDRLLAIRAVERAMGQKAKRRMAVRAASIGAVFAVAASIALYVVTKKAPKPFALEPTPSLAVADVVEGSAVTIRGRDELPLSSSVAVSAGDRIVARPRSNARIKLWTGSTLVVEEGGDLSIVEHGASQVFSLALGAMRAEVAKLTLGQRFVVRTPEAELEAWGTSFRVARIQGGPSCEGGLTTKLFVYEGRVVARATEHEASIGPGQEWTAECERRVVLPIAPPNSTSVTSEMPSARAAPPARGLQPINDLFAEAMDAKARGDKAKALSALQQLETRYPASPLAESATVERMKILASTNPKAAAGVAKRYLSNYPDGFARNVA